MAVTVIEDRRELEDVWRERTIAARERYCRAKQVVKMARVEWADGHLPMPDGNLWYRQTLEREHEALIEYRRVLEAFNGLVLRYEVPDENRQK